MFMSWAVCVCREPGLFDTIATRGTRLTRESADSRPGLADARIACDGWRRWHS